MSEEVEKLKQLIDASLRILITSHIGPDGDSISSTLLLLKILRLNFQDKTIEAVIEEPAYGLDFLDGLAEINVKSLPAALNEVQPDLLIILDANTVSRITRRPDEVRRYISDTRPKLVIIDHHEPAGVENSDLYINNSSPAVTLDIYEIFLKTMNLKRPDGYAQIAITGIYTDTGGFVNRNLNYAKTFGAVPKLIEDGADIEKVASELSRVSDTGFEVYRLFVNNLKLEDSYAYSYLQDDALSADPVSIEAVKQAADLIRSGLLRNIGHRDWGFIIYKDVLAASSIYSVSFRALSDVKDVSRIAAKLGGGGHKPAAGAKIEAASVEAALDKVKQAIAES